MSQAVGRQCLLAAALVVLLAGCAFNPLGISDEAWAAMSEAQRHEARLQQAELDRARAEQRAAEARLREAEVAREAQLLEQRRRDARPGERLQCVIDPVEGRLGGKWRTADPVLIDVVTGIDTRFTIDEDRRRSRYSAHGHARFDGRTLLICPEPPDSRHARSACARVVGNRSDFRSSIQQPIEVSRLLRGQLRCDPYHHRSRRR